jgi:hypothetical protein
LRFGTTAGEGFQSLGHFSPQYFESKLAAQHLCPIFLWNSTLDKAIFVKNLCRFLRYNGIQKLRHTCAVTASGTYTNKGREGRIRADTSEAPVGQIGVQCRTELKAEAAIFIKK